MKILVVGSGGREHALVWKIARSERVTTLYAAPGSAGMAALATCLPEYRVDTAIEERDLLEAEILRLRDFAVAEGIDITVVGPEDALAAGIVDRFREAGLKVFGPTRAAAQIESDKAFAKQLMTSIGVPTEGLALIVGVDRLLDMFRTMTNVVGDSAATAMLARLEGEDIRIMSDKEDRENPNKGFEGRLDQEPTSVPVEGDEA